MMRLTVSIIVPTLLFGCGICSLSKEFEKSFPRVVTPLGIIEGYYKTSSNGRRYEAYEGIPYAHQPTGESRFGVPRSVSPWTGIFMARQFGPPCLQYNIMQQDDAHDLQGSEDCLYMNIYTAIADDNKTSTDLLPVIFHIYGGAFQFGNAMNYRPGYLLDKNVTLVTFNYRVGPLGFLSTEDETVPGNMGLKDQVIAMRWVKDNIESFGGDPSRITIFGQSAGGASVHYHYLTNITAGLFQGGMSMSGTALNCWAQTENSLEKTKKLATMIGCPTDNIPSMVDCLKTRPAHQIVQAAKIFASWSYGPHIPFGPVVEKRGSEFTFIDRPPIEIINSGEVQDLPWITSVVSEEGLTPVAAFVGSEGVLKHFNDMWDSIAPHILDFNYTVPMIDHQKLARLIKQHYLGTSPINKSTINQTVQMIGDRLFGYLAEKAARSQARANQSPVRFYYFSYRGLHSLSETFSGSSENFGVSHGDDQQYVLNSNVEPMTVPKDRDMQEQMVNLWVSFATEGTPSVGVEWPELNESTDELNYLHIAGPDAIAMETSPNFARKNFWQSINFHENNDQAQL